MTNLAIKQYFPDASTLAYGCMGLGGDWDNSSITSAHISQAQQVIETALANGITFFDHADIYTKGKAEQCFAQVLKQRPNLRDNMIIQSKCGIRFNDEFGPGRYDFSKQWIIESVEGILSRLNIESLDVLLLHRPDPLMEVAEVASAFDSLQAAGKVQHFGVSNMNHHQIQFLQSALSTPLIANQVEISLKQLGWLEHGVLAGNPEGSHQNFCAGTLEYCQQQNIQLQSWGSLAQGLFSGRNTEQQAPHIQATAQLVNELAEQYHTNSDAIVLAWLLRHPANIQPIIGTTNIERINRCAQATNIALSREDWYKLFVSARGRALP
ncbi:aldo/keto reductase [Colwellia sp. MEBiC06753]